MFANKSILITGGTGSFARAFIQFFLQKYPDISRLIIYSRDEQKQFEIQEQYPKIQFPQIRFFIGDIRDKERLIRALENVDYVIHAAALKQVPTAEYNPFECIKTNILGTQNVIDASIICNVKRVLGISTDKAAAPTNLYGATKLCADRLFTAANNYVGDKNIKFSSVRYGNLMGSRGSVIPYFLQQKKQKKLPITDKRMTRFGLKIHEELEFVLFCLKEMWGGEIFVKKSPSFRLVDLAAAICPECELEEVGIRPGERLHEIMVTETDSLNTLEFQEYFVILPTIRSWKIEEYAEHFHGKFCEDGFQYSSYNNKQWYTIEDLKKFVQYYEKNNSTNITKF